MCKVGSRCGDAVFTLELDGGVDRLGAVGGARATGTCNGPSRTTSTTSDPRMGMELHSVAALLMVESLHKQIIFRPM